MRTPAALVGALVSTFVVLVAGPASADPGDLDSSFDGGTVTLDFTFGHDEANGVLIQPNGKIVVAGTAQGPSTTDLGHARYLTVGDPDLTYNDPLGNARDNKGAYETVTDIIRSGSRHVLGGGTTAGPDQDFLLAGYEIDGDIDNTFGTSSGYTITDFGDGGADVLEALALQPDGRIVAAGWSETNTDGGDFIVARYEPNGHLDMSFSTDGITRTDFDGLKDLAFDVIVQPNGKIVVGGSAGTSEGADFGLVRYLANGKRDRAYGDDGWVTTDFLGELDEIHGLARQSDGRIVAAGDRYNTADTDGAFALARYETSGALDTTFDGDGKAVVNVSPSAYDQALDVAIQSSGKIVAVGDDGDSDFALIRLKPDGTLNTSFGDGGKVTTDIPGDGSSALAVAIQSDGKIVVAGRTAFLDGDFIVARYLGA